MPRKSKKISTGKRSSPWIWIFVGLVLIIALFGESKAKLFIYGFLGPGVWLIGPAMVTLSVLRIFGYDARALRLWRNRVIVLVPLISFTIASLQAAFSGNDSAGGVIGSLLPGLLAGLLGGLAYWLCAVVGLGLLYLAILKPMMKKWKIPLPSAHQLVDDVFSGNQKYSAENSRATKAVSDSAKTKPANKKSAKPKAVVAPSGSTLLADDLADDEIDDNEELFFDALPEPIPDIPLKIDSILDSPPASRKPISPESLKKLQGMIQDAARRLSKIDLEPAGDPVVGMTSIRFSFEKASGQSVSVTKVLDLSDDLSVETNRSPVRIFIDSTVNFELPLDEEERQFVPIKSLLLDADPVKTNEDINYLIGRKQDGTVFELSAHSALHMLIGGATGGGKSVLLHTIIWGLIFRYPPSKVRLALYDHKIEEFAPYQNLPHLWQPVVTNEGGYHRLIKNLKAEITRRKLARRDDPDAKFTWLVVIMDEFRGLSNDTFVALIAEARSLQIRFVLGTQRAEKSFISTSIKANLPTGISFRVRNQMESRLIIGEPDACNLLPHGDCIVHSPSEMERVQAGWVKKDDLKALRAHLK